MLRCGVIRSVLCQHATIMCHNFDQSHPALSLDLYCFDQRNESEFALGHVTVSRTPMISITVYVHAGSTDRERYLISQKPLAMALLFCDFVDMKVTPVQQIQAFSTLIRQG